ncbi:PAS domain-containing protein [Halorubellus sp. PRR65]|uniref:receiver/sensor box histidine kinase n=1 Tax=Halorubellus sp. PRR65 TaxID=3098148 RepID=UPI002B261F87|nr:PAS domain-containing protein [Halorubellus sp. PRR65]
MTTDADPRNDADATAPRSVALGALVPGDDAFDGQRFAREHGFDVVHAGAPGYSGVARVGATAASAIALVPDADGPSALALLDALRERTTLPVVLYGDDVEAAVLESFLDADATDYVRRHPDGSELVLAKRLRAAAEHATLVESHSLLERAVDQAEVGITIADGRTGDEPLIYVNEGFARLTGYSVTETVGRNCRFLQGDGTDPETVATLRAAIENEDAASVDIRNYRQDGTPFWNHLNISPIFDAEGTLTHYLGFQRDVTERKRLQAELEAQNERLADFANVVSHDLRNPLAVAQGRLDVTGDGDEPDEADLVAASAALERMDSLIADVLALAREGDVVEETEPVALGELATYAWSMVETGDLALDVPEAVVVHADRDRLVSVLENLFRNAVEHGSPCSQTESENTVAHASGASTVTVSAGDDGFVVADDGPGIPEAERDEVFARGHTTDPDGTGFGLAIVAAIADAHGWTVAVTESADGGAAFAFHGVTVERPT